MTDEEIAGMRRALANYREALTKDPNATVRVDRCLPRLEKLLNEVMDLRATLDDNDIFRIFIGPFDGYEFHQVHDVTPVKPSRLRKGRDDDDFTGWVDRLGEKTPVETCYEGDALCWQVKRG